MNSNLTRATEFSEQFSHESKSTSGLNLIYDMSAWDLLQEAVLYVDLDSIFSHNSRLVQMTSRQLSIELPTRNTPVPCRFVERAHEHFFFCYELKCLLNIFVVSDFLQLAIKYKCWAIKYAIRKAFTEYLCSTLYV